MDRLLVASNWMGTWMLYVVLLLVISGIAALIFFLRYLKGKSLQNLDEATGILFFLFAFLVALSLLSYDGGDIHQLAEPANLAGIIGALIAEGLLAALGIASWIVPLLLVLWGLAKLRDDFSENIVSLTILIIVLALLFTSMSSITRRGSQLGYFALDGAIGKGLGILAESAFGRLGSYFVLAAAGFVAFILTTGFTPTSLLKQAPKKRRRRISAPTPSVEPEVASEQSTYVSSIPTLPPETQMDEEYRRTFLSLLSDPQETRPAVSRNLVEERATILQQKLSDFEIKGKVVGFFSGPLITRYEFEPAAGIKVSKIVPLADDLALAMKSGKIRIVVPIPGKSALGIEIPNPHRGRVNLKEVLTSEDFVKAPSRLTIALGNGIAGNPYFADLAAMPHLLIAGATGSGKSVCINSVIASILFRATEREVRFIMIDPKRLELPVYNGIPHLVRPVIINSKESLDVLQMVIDCMEMRYSEFARAGVRDIEGFNQKVPNGKPYIVLIIDELADLMLTAPSQIEEKLTRLAQMSRAVGIHLILATQRPSVDVITGLIKANFPARMAFQVASKTDSRTILDMNGAEKLLGRGDMLFLPPGRGEPVRVHGAYISTEEAKRIATLLTKRYAGELFRENFGEIGDLVDQFIEDDLIDSVAGSGEARDVKLKLMADRIAEQKGLNSESVLQSLERLQYYQPIEMGAFREQREPEEGGEGEVDELFKEAARLVVRHNLASVSLLQRRFKIGYARAGRIIDQLERAGVIGPYEGSKAREVLVEQGDLQQILQQY